MGTRRYGTRLKTTTAASTGIIITNNNLLRRKSASKEAMLSGCETGNEPATVTLSLDECYLKGRPQVLQPCPQHVAEGVLKGHPEHHHRTAVMPVEIDTLRYLKQREKMKIWIVLYVQVVVFVGCLLVCLGCLS